MKDELFNDMLESIRKGSAILRGEKAPSRTFNIEKPDASLPVATKSIEMDDASSQERKFSKV